MSRMSRNGNRTNRTLAQQKTKSARHRAKYVPNRDTLNNTHAIRKPFMILLPDIVLDTAVSAVTHQPQKKKKRVASAQAVAGPAPLLATLLTMKSSAGGERRTG